MAIPIEAMGAYAAAGLLIIVAIIMIIKKGITWTSGSIIFYTIFKAAFLIFDTLYHYIGSKTLAILLYHLRMSSSFLFAASFFSFPLSFRTKDKEHILWLFTIAAALALLPFGFNIRESMEQTTEWGFVGIMQKWFFWLMMGFMALCYLASCFFLIWMTSKTLDRPDITKKLAIILLVGLFDLGVSASIYTYIQYYGLHPYLPLVQGISMPIIFALLLYGFLLPVRETEEAQAQEEQTE